LRDRLIARNALYVTGGLEPYDHRVFIEEVTTLLAEFGVETRYNCKIDQVLFNESEAILLLESGEEIHASTVVDATGDAHIAHLARVPYTMAERSGVMPLTYCYLLGPIDLNRLKERHPSAFRNDTRTGESYVHLGGQEWLVERVRQARECGDLTIPRERIAVAYSVPGSPEVISVNFGRVRIKDPTDEKEMARAKEEGLRQVHEGVAFFRKYVAGFEEAGVVELADQIGVRESRQIDGVYRLTGEDVLSGRQFDDVIAQCCYHVDIHDPDTDSTTLVVLPHGTHYDIPLRSLIPTAGPDNLIVAGRCISATQEAMSSFRVSPSVMAIGEAAGTAAALAAQSRCPIRAIPAKSVQEALRSGGAILE